MMELEGTWRYHLARAAWLRPTAGRCSKFHLKRKQAVEQLFSAVFSVTTSPGKTYSRTLSINCQSTAFIVRTLFIALVLIPEKPDSASPIIIGTGPGRWEGKHCVLLKVIPSAFVWHQEKAMGMLHVSPLSLFPTPGELMGELSSFSPRSLGFSKPELVHGIANGT